MKNAWFAGLGRSMAMLCAMALSGAAMAEDKHAHAGHDHAHAKIGETAPDFTLKTADGKTIKLSDYKDKIVVLEWCNYECPFSHKDAKTAAFPKMKELQKEWAAKGVVWLAIDSTSTHNPESVTEFYKEHPVDYPILLDTDGKVGHQYGAATTPHMFIINKGKLVYMGAHDDKASRNYIAETLEAVTSGKDVPVAETKPYGCSVKYPKKGNA